MTLETDLERRLAATRGQIRQAEQRFGREPGSVRLLAVSKTQPAEVIRAAYHAGQRDFGENYVQELVDKAAELADLSDLRWHMIGHLQSNKVRAIAPIASCVQSVSSTKLVSELERRLVTHGGRSRDGIEKAPPLPILIEVNVGGEEQKSGCTPEELGEVLALADQAPHLRAVGLMTIPPFGMEPEASRPYFQELAALREAHGGAARLPELSMGMSGDWEVAVACGATWVRIGTALFGQRPQKQLS